MLWLVVVGVLGLVLGWIVRGRSSPNRRDLVEYDERAQRAERRLRSVVVERDNEHASVLTLRAALRSERQLLDGVADQSGVDPETFRRIISKEYLGRELVVSPASLVDFDFGTNRAADAEVEELQRLLRAKETQLAEAREQIHRIRADVESLAVAGRPANSQTSGAVLTDPSAHGERATTTTVVGDFSVGAEQEANEGRLSEATLDVREEPAVIDLCDTEPRRSRPTVQGPGVQGPGVQGPGVQDSGVSVPADSPVISPERLRFLEDRAASAQLLAEEVATLRARLADTAVANDDVRARIEFRRSLDNELAQLVAHLDELRVRARGREAADHARRGCRPRTLNQWVTPNNVRR